MKRHILVVQTVGTVAVIVLVLYGLACAVRDLSVGRRVSAEGQGVDSLSVSSAIPQTVNYQGLLRETNGILTTGQYTITARIHALATGGTHLYETTVSGVTVRDGLFNIVLGENPSLPSTVLAEVPRYVGISLNGGDELIPRQRLHAVPWAMLATHAYTADSATAAVSAITATTAVTATTLVAGAGIRDVTVGGTGLAFTPGSGVTSDLPLDGNLLLSSGDHLRFDGLDDFRLIYREGFETSASGWKFIYGPNNYGRYPWNDETGALDPLTTNIGYNSVLLGCNGYPTPANGRSDGELYKLLTLPAGNQEVVVRLTYYSFDSWDSKTGWVTLDGLDGSGTPIAPASWLETMALNDWSRRPHGCDPDHRDAARFVELRASTESSQIRISANSNIPGAPNTGADWESFAVDNVEVWVR